MTFSSCFCCFAFGGIFSDSQGDWQGFQGNASSREEKEGERSATPSLSVPPWSAGCGQGVRAFFLCRWARHATGRCQPTLHAIKKIIVLTNLLGNNGSYPSHANGASIMHSNSIIRRFLCRHRSEQNLSVVCAPQRSCPCAQNLSKVRSSCMWAWRL